MDIGLLQTFLEVSKTRHFGNAAQNLHLTQSAVSARIKQLEGILGVAVFVRQRNNIMLTPSGDRLIPHAESILAAWQSAVQEVGVPGNNSVQLSLGGTSNLWDTFLQSVLPKLAARFPNLYIRTEINSPQGLIRSLLGRRLDISTVLEAPSNVDLDTRRIGELELLMITHQPGLTTAEIPSVGHVFVDWGTALNLRQAQLFAEPVAPVLHTGQSHIALEFLLTRGGACFLPKALVQTHLENGLLHAVADAEAARQAVYAVFSKEAAKSPQLSAIIAMFDELDIKPEYPLRAAPAAQ